MRDVWRPAVHSARHLEEDARKLTETSTSFAHSRQTMGSARPRSVISIFHSPHLSHTSPLKSLSLTSIGPCNAVTPLVLSRLSPVWPETPPRSSVVVNDAGRGAGSGNEIFDLHRDFGAGSAAGELERAPKVSSACKVKNLTWSGKRLKGGTASNVLMTLRRQHNATITFDSRNLGLHSVSLIILGKQRSISCLGLSYLGINCSWYACTEVAREFRFLPSPFELQR